MSNIDDFGITPYMVFRFMNPTFDPAGFQISYLFNLLAQTIAKNNGNSVTLDLSSLGPIGRNQLQGYRLFIDDDLNTAYGITSNGESDSDGMVIINSDSTLPADGTWDILGKAPQITFQTNDVQDEILNGVLQVRNALRPEYVEMLEALIGWQLWGPKERGGFNADTTPLTTNIPLPFWKAANVRVWLNPVYDYMTRLVGCTGEITDKFTIESNDTTKVSNIRADTYVPADGSVIAVDFNHDLQPVPATLKRAGLNYIRGSILLRSSSQTPEQRDSAMALMSQAKSSIKNIPEFDRMPLYRSMKPITQSGHQSIPLRRG